MKNIALIIVTYNQKDITLKTIKLLKEQTVVPDIIVVDNNSSDNTKELILEKYPDIITLKARDNFGSSGGQYIGSRYAYEKGYEWIILSDNDAFPISENLIEELVKNATPNIVTQPWNVDEDNKESNHFWPLHYACYHNKILKKLKFPLFEFFLYGDDLEYYQRLKRCEMGIKKMNNIFYSHPMKRSYLPSRFYLNHRNYLNIAFFYNGYVLFLFQVFLFANSLFVYKIIGEKDYYLFGIKAINNFLDRNNENSLIKKDSKIYSPLISSTLALFVKKNARSLINVHKKTNKFLKMTSLYGKVKNRKNLVTLIKSKKMVSESIISSDVMLYSFLFNKYIISIDEIDERDVAYRENKFPSFILKFFLLLFNNISHIYLFVAIIVKSFYLYIKKNTIYEFNKKYDSMPLKSFYEN